MRRLNADFVVVRMAMVICFGTVRSLPPPPSPPFYMMRNSLSSCPSWRVIVVIGPGACFGMVG